MCTRVYLRVRGRVRGCDKCLMCQSTLRPIAPPAFKGARCPLSTARWLMRPVSARVYPSVRLTDAWAYHDKERLPFKASASFAKQTGSKRAY